MRNEQALRNEARVLELRAQGLTVDQIAADESVGITTPSGVAKALRRALEKDRSVAVEAFRGYAWKELDEINRQTVAILESPTASDGDRLRALDLRRRVLTDRGELIGYGKALERAHAAAEAEISEMPEAGPGFLNVVSLDGAPTDVLPREFEAVGVIPPDTVLILVDPDWQLHPAGIGVFSRDGKLKRGNTLLRCEPEELDPFLEWRRMQRDERHAQARAARGLPNADRDLIVDP
ncbi:hypothetical protein GMA12_00140 [Kocuria sediminis]|uniref:Uncharacterized protein n=1 Tax=Kocuria sediminis TaxID=1038857 RepID=A0A6N8GFU8_9MICC|nr:hypothetical protein [Kocuria sediminis]MUN61579.1 hypothetical protein [Kocuria sediminis]